ncbi:MAG: TetR family transcriptional regulator C-terminal domain-containing protein [Paracoccaceae bacterium]
MSGIRRKFRREGEERRRDQLIAAALDLIAESGTDGATVRAIAARAGVTQGLIRHYFSSKEELTRAAYDTLMSKMTEASMASLVTRSQSPEAALAAFVVTTFSPQLTGPREFGLWSGFIRMVLRDPEMAEIHEANYLAYRDQLQALIAGLPGAGGDPERHRQLAIACNGLLDGLWLEGSLYPHGFREGELVHSALAAVGKIVGVDLMAYRPAPPITTLIDQRELQP